MTTHQEPDAELAEEPLVMLVVLLVVKLDVVQGVVGGGQAHLTPPVQLKLTLLGVNLSLFEEAGGRQNMDGEKSSGWFHHKHHVNCTL